MSTLLHTHGVGQYLPEHTLATGPPHLKTSQVQICICAGGGACHGIIPGVQHASF